MIALLSPAKKMRHDPDSLAAQTIPQFLPQTEILLDQLRSLPLPQLQELLCCNQKLALQAFQHFSQMNLYSQDTTPALCAYVGIQYQYMLPGAFTDEQLTYAQTHLRILSGFYGVLRPLDGIFPYRLEMQTRLAVGPYRDLYAFWGPILAQTLETEAEGIILNLASEEYAKAVRPYLGVKTRWITPIFGQLNGDKVREKGVYVKMARGEMARFLAQNHVETLEDITAFSSLGFTWDKNRSTLDTPVFLKK